MSHSYSIGFKRHKQYRHYAYNKSVVHKDDVHELDNYRNLLRGLGFKITGFLPSIRNIEIETRIAHDKDNESVTRVSETLAAKKSCLKNLSAQHKKVVVFHPFPGGVKKEFKMWPEKNWQQLGKELLKEGYCVWITGSSAEAEHAEKIAHSISDPFYKLCDFADASKTAKTKSTTKQTRLAVKSIVSLAGQISWEETAWLLSRAKMLVSVNTGLMHLAAAIGVKVIALNGPTSTNRWGAIGKYVINFRSTYECSPCLSLGFEYACKAGGCMTRIRVDDIKEAANNSS